jgi:hypothetical protein
LKKVIKVSPIEDYQVIVEFDDGVTKIFDMKNLVGAGKFSPLADPRIFTEKCTILNDTLAWDLKGNRSSYDCLDIDPLTIYKEGKNFE